MRDALARDKGAWTDICVEYQRARGLFLGVRLQIDHADVMVAGLQIGSVGLGLLHRVAMCHQVSGGIGELVLYTLRPTYSGGSLGHEQH